jgi:uncharacterized membrane protein YedE/YeeE
VKPTLVSLALGILFGAGLAVSGMTNPAKVQNFLDVFGSFDPSLALVMGGALAVSAVGYQLARRAEAPWLGTRFELPTRSALDTPLLVGSALFGIGWGLGGFCPGPALAGLLQGASGVYLFVAAMLAGVALHRWVYLPLRDRRDAPGAGDTPSRVGEA